MNISDAWAPPPPPQVDLFEADLFSVSVGADTWTVVAKSYRDVVHYVGRVFALDGTPSLTIKRLERPDRVYLTRVASERIGAPATLYKALVMDKQTDAQCTIICDDMNALVSSVGELYSDEEIVSVSLHTDRAVLVCEYTTEVKDE